MSSSEDEHGRNMSDDEDASEDDVPEEEDDELDEDDEQEVARAAVNDRKKRKSEAHAKPKKKRRGVSKFIEEEADVDEEDEEEEEGEEDFEAQQAEDAEAAQHYRYKPMRLDSSMEDEETAEAIVSGLKKRHQQNRRHYDEDEEGGDIQSDVAQQSLLPSIQDPRMWIFKCKPGREQHLVIALMNKFLDMSSRGEPLHIKSVIASSSKGFIYVEADREPHAKDAVNGLRDIQQYSMKLVPIHEMTAVLNVKSKRKPIVAGAWARFKRAGLYKGDLCKVLEILDNGSRAMVRMIPRLDPIVLAGGEAPKYKKGQRPPQKLFNANLVHNGEGRRRHPTMGEMMETFDGDYYHNGFLVKEVNIATMLQTEEVNPNLDEINRFSAVVGGDENGNEEPTSNLEADDWKNKVDLAKGDTVRVIEGDLVNLMGVVVGTNTGNDTVRVMPLHEEIKDTILDFQLRQLMKYVKVGDHIKVVSGRYSGETGTVVAVDDSDSAPIAIVLVDSMAKEIQVRVRDIQESAEVSHGLDSLKGKELYDLVQLAQGDVGVITHVGREGFKVLTQSGQSRDISDQEIQRKLVASRAVALDMKQNHISVGEMVNVTDGPFTGHSGTVKHIYRTFLFLHNNRITTNAGIFVARARQVVLSGSKARSNMIQNSTVPNADGRPMRAGMPPRNDRRNESEMIGKTVKIKRGMWKGYIGIVVEETEQKVKVEIHSKAKIVDVDRLHITTAGTRAGAIEERPRVTNTPMSGATPMPSQTPLHGAMTPMATPMNRGFGTPSSRGEAWSAANDDDLLETQINQEREITHATSFGAPLDPVPAPGDYSSSRSHGGSSSSYAPRSPTREPITPAANPVTPGLHPTTPGLQPRTPAYMIPNNPVTPGLNPTTPGLNPTTPAQLSAATPGIMHDHGSMEPMTPGFNPTTPGLPAMTPGLNPMTPGINTPGYHHNPMTPGISVATPGVFGRMGSAATPGATPAQTVGIPATPAYQREADDVPMSGAGSEVTWKMKGVEVRVERGEHRGDVGVITSVSGDSCSLDCDGRILTLSLEDLTPTVPEKQDTVIILSGDDAGTTGPLIGVDGSDGIVTVGSDIKIYPLSSLAKLVQ